MKKTLLNTMKALSLVEVIIALAIVSMVFVYVNSTMFASVRRVKKLELQDKMLEYANEGVEVVRREKDKDWQGFLAKFPQNTKTTYIQYDQSGAPTIASGSQFLGCRLDPLREVLTGTGCSDTNPEAAVANAPPSSFGRIIVLKSSDLSSNYAVIEVTIACIENQCSAEDFKPIKLTTYVYRTTSR
jgi:prepilin-type N-terminal cleavage/methylation domain-containing protein